MPFQVNQITVTGALCRMHGLLRGYQQDTETRAIQTPTQVNIFVIQKITFIKSTHKTKQRCPEYHEHATDPVWMQWLSGNGIFHVGAPKKGFLQNADRCRKSARTVFDLPRWRNDQRANNADGFILQLPNQSMPWVPHQTNVRIEHAKISAAGHGGGGIMICGITLSHRIMDGCNGKRKKSRIKRQGFRHIYSQQHFNPGIAMSNNIRQQCSNQVPLAVADDGNAENGRLSGHKDETDCPAICPGTPVLHHNPGNLNR